MCLISAPLHRWAPEFEEPLVEADCPLRWVFSMHGVAKCLYCALDLPYLRMTLAAQHTFKCYINCYSRIFSSSEFPNGFYALAFSTFQQIHSVSGMDINGHPVPVRTFFFFSPFMFIFVHVSCVNLSLETDIFAQPYAICKARVT